MPYDEMEDLDLGAEDTALLGALDMLDDDIPAELEGDDDPELGDIDSDEDDELSGEDELDELDSELSAMEGEYGGDDDELGALPRRRFQRSRSLLRRYRQRRASRYQRAGSRWKRRYSSMRRKRDKAIRYAKRNRGAARKNAKIARKLYQGAKKEATIGRLTGFRGPTGNSFAGITGATTTTTLTARPQKDVTGGQLIINEVASSGAAAGASVVKEIKIGVYPLLSSNDGVALSAFNQDSTMNMFSWPEAEVGNEITIDLERSAGPGGSETVTYTAALGPYMVPRTVTKVRR